MPCSIADSLRRHQSTLSCCSATSKYWISNGNWQHGRKSILRYRPSSQSSLLAYSSKRVAVKIVQSTSAPGAVLRPSDCPHGSSSAAGTGPDDRELDLYITTVNGGGISSQAGAIRHGITRALMQYDRTLRSNCVKLALLLVIAHARLGEMKVRSAAKRKRVTRYSSR